MTASRYQCSRCAIQLQSSAPEFEQAHVLYVLAVATHAQSVVGANVRRYERSGKMHAEQPAALMYDNVIQEAACDESG